MSVTNEKETRGFEAEVKQLLNLMIHSLYSNKEIFLRELISNASDAEEKLRFSALSSPGLYEADTQLQITVTVDKTARTVTVCDNGIGMNREEIIANLGTIARSGTKEFVAALQKKQDAELIGQFGVGFYSGFIVADQITVNSRKAGTDVTQGVSWQSHGDGQYTVETIERAQHGTEVILHLKEGEDEFLDDYRLRSIIQKYSDHISFPIRMAKEEVQAEDEAQQAEISVVPTYETVNKATALWALAKKDISDKDYQEFYKHIAHDFNDPLTWSHNRVEGNLDYINLLYIPAQAPFDLWNRDIPRGLKLYVHRIFIMDEAEQFLPLYLRFVRGVIDSNDLPLNVSREILQSNKTTEAIRTALTKRVLSMLEKLAEENQDAYAKFWLQFGQTLKEGVVEDHAQRELIAKLLRFSSTFADTQKQDVSLDAYISRMQPDQDAIYYLTADGFNAAQHSPHLEIFRDKGIEVLLLCDRIDEWLVGHLTEYQGKKLRSVAKGDLDLGQLEKEEDKQDKKAKEDELATLLKQIKEVLADKVKEVRITHRLTHSPACVVADDYDMSAHMQRILQAAGQDIPKSAPILELNPTHKFVVRLQQESDEESFKEWTHLLFEQALLAEGATLSDPAGFVQRMNKLLLESVA